MSTSIACRAAPARVSALAAITGTVAFPTFAFAKGDNDGYITVVL
jgi:hypothetical protein